MTPEQIAAQLPDYEGLIFRTAAIIEPHVELEMDDIRQRMRIKAWRALSTYDPAKAKQSVAAYVFQCVKNEQKDIVKQKRRHELHIEGLKGDDEDDNVRKFEGRYMSITAEETFAEVEEEQPELPSTLTELERQVIHMLCEGWLQTEIRSHFSLSVRSLYSLLASIRVKMADWRPSSSERAPRPDPASQSPGPVQPTAPSPARQLRSPASGVSAPTRGCAVAA